MIFWSKMIFYHVILGCSLSFLTFSFLFPSAVYANQSKLTLVLASVDNIPPYIFVDRGNLTGLSVDIINELAKRADFNVEIKTYPWARVLRETQEGYIDGAFAAYYTEERNEFSLYTWIIHYDELRLAVRTQDQFPFNKLEDLYGKTIAKGRSVFVGNNFNAAVQEGKIHLIETNDMNMKNMRMLLAGRVDAVIGSPVALTRYSKELGIEDKTALLPVPIKEKIPAYLILSKASPLPDKKKWKEKITSILKEMWKDGTIPAINRRYGLE